MRKTLTLSVKKTRYNVIHEISPGVRYKPAKSESYSPIRWFLSQRTGIHHSKLLPISFAALRSLHLNIHDASLQFIVHLLTALCTTLRLSRTSALLSAADRVGSDYTDRVRAGDSTRRCISRRVRANPIVLVYTIAALAVYS
jgi:hypothetical protein